MPSDEEPPAEIDAELARLAAAPRRRSPIVAAAVVALAALLVFHLRSELLYAFASRTPQDLGDARALFAGGAAPAGLADNRYVIVRGQPDHRNSLHIEPRGEKVRQDFFRLYGTGSRLFVRAADSKGRLDLADEWTGRLRRFDALPYAPSLRGYYAERVQATRYFSAETLKRALAAHLAAGARVDVTDRAGQPLALRGDETVRVDVSFPEELVVTMPGEKFPTPADAQHELERMGYTLAPRAATTRTFDGQSFFAIVIRAPAAERNRILDALDGKGIPVAAYEDRWSARLDELKDEGTALAISGQSVPWAQIRSAGVDEPIAIADDAWVLTEGEAPGGFWWAPLLAVLLVAFAAFNAWVLLRPRRV